MSYRTSFYAGVIALFSASSATGLTLVRDGQTLYLAGGRPRGTLDAVFMFLEDVVGCRWWTSTGSFITSRPTAATQAIWRGIAPVLYATATMPRTLAFPVDFETFLVWGDPDAFAKPDEDLPFTGPCSAL